MSWKPLYILIACEESQAECKAFRKLGHIAFSCDIQKCRKSANPEWHIQGDCSALLAGRTCFMTQTGEVQKVPRWDLIVAHPPCTYLTKCGSNHMYSSPDFVFIHDGIKKYLDSSRYTQMMKAREFFFLCLGAKAKYVAVENPIPMRMAHLPKPTTYTCPSFFGCKYTKKTLYWLKNLPDLMPTITPGKQKSLVHCSRGKYRSRTYEGLARAMAEQWSDYILNQH